MNKLYLKNNTVVFEQENADPFYLSKNHSTFRQINKSYILEHSISGLSVTIKIDGSDVINDVGVQYTTETLIEFLSLNFSSAGSSALPTAEQLSAIIPDASATTRGFVNTISQTFAGIKTFNNMIWAKKSPSDTVNTNNGTIGLGSDGTNPLFSFRLDSGGNLKLDKVYSSVFSNVLSINRNSGLFCLGKSAGYNNTGSDIGLISGYQSGQNNTGSKIGLISGYEAGYDNLGSYIGLISGYWTGHNNRGSYIGLISGYEAGNYNFGNNIGIISGYKAGYNNTGYYIGLMSGSYAGHNNIGSYIGLMSGGYAGHDNRGSYIGLISGYYAGYNNTGSEIGLMSGVLAGQNNTGGGIGLISGYYSGQNNTGNDVGLMSGSYAGRNNTGNYVISIGSRSLEYNQKNNNIAIGNYAYANFLDNYAGSKTFDNNNINTGTDRITINNHGFGYNSGGAWINVKYTQGSSEIGGLTNNSIYQVKIIDDNTLSFRELISGTVYHGTDITSAGTGTGHRLTPQFAYENTISIGSGVHPTKDNQVLLGNSSTNEVLIGGNLAIDKNALVYAANNSPLYVRVINGVKTITV